MGQKTGVLFVCTGNICRSPTAEGVFRKVVEESAAADRYVVASAGTHDYHVGEPPDRRATAAARERGYDLSSIRARQFTVSDFDRFHWFIALDEGHYHILRQAAPPRHRERVRLFMDFAAGSSLRSVPDPYYGGQDGFERVLDMIEEGSRGLLRYLELQRSAD